MTGPSGGLAAALRSWRAGGPRTRDLRARSAAVRDGRAAVRVAAVSAALGTGVLDQLAESPATAAALGARGGWPEHDLLHAFLEVLAQQGLVSQTRGHWELTRRGRAVLRDDVARAAYEAFGGYHTGLYRELVRQLGGGAGRRDIADSGEVIARLSHAMDPFVLGAVGAAVHRRRPRRILDVGCGTGDHLVHMLRGAPGASAVGIEIDPVVAALARDSLVRHGVAERARVVAADARQVLESSTERFDWVLLANVVYYFSADERARLLASLARRLERGGAVMVVTTTRSGTHFSRHFDLLLRAQAGGTGLPSSAELRAQLRTAGLRPGRLWRIAPGPVTAVVATRP